MLLDTGNSIDGCYGHLFYNAYPCNIKKVQLLWDGFSSQKRCPKIIEVINSLSNIERIKIDNIWLIIGDITRDSILPGPMGEWYKNYV